MRKCKIIWSFFCAFVLCLLPVQPACAAQDREDISLYATAAALVDAETGRVLYGKNQDTPMAMASTTKIMTCIIILENLDLDEEVTVSDYAASMPKVKLYVKCGEKYKVRNLLFSMMLESHNDSAVVLAENLGKRYLSDELKNKDTAEFTTEESKQAVAEFARLMNEKAEEIGCTQTYFLTPNGLDATQTITMEDGGTVTKEHCTTAAELAQIMSYCVLSSPMRDLFREITAEASYSFSENGRSFSCSNHNAFLSMMDGAFSGKTGFTNKAGYCYVGALERDGRTYVVALLACGWPNNKSYKWSDTRELMEFGLENYTYRDFEPETALADIVVENGASPDGSPYQEVSIAVEREGGVLPIHMLACDGESIEAEVECKSALMAPVSAGEQVGSITYYLNEASGDRRLLAEEKLFTGQNVEVKDLKYIMRYIGDCFLVF
ncbi:MAG: D-alanyl-D-alanine carboxypeptidase [Lachnospiraceae bacterium]|nr:D-alanyl-D-alanine carboxypeptidase [Lachnospiraceae bacterium]